MIATKTLNARTPLKSWAVMSRLNGGQSWHIEHAKNPSVTTLGELAAWGCPKPGQWNWFGKQKIALWTSILAEAGLEWQGSAPLYPRGNPMYCNIAPITEEPEDIVYRLQVSIDNNWIENAPIALRALLDEAIREIRGNRYNEERLHAEIEELKAKVKNG